MEAMISGGAILTYVGCGDGYVGGCHDYGCGCGCDCGRVDVWTDLWTDSGIGCGSVRDSLIGLALVVTCYRSGSLYSP